MRHALISDVHANLPALEAVLADIASRIDIDTSHHLGDLVGYAPWPNEVIELLRAAGISGVAGNYDSTVATRYKHCGCRAESERQEELAHESFTWTLEHVTEESTRYLRGLPFRIDLRPLGGHMSGPTIRLVHGSNVLNTVYVTEDRSDDFLAKMAHAMDAHPGDAICFGHTHVAWHRVVNGVHFVNTGSVGRPKDGDPRAGYAIVSVDEAGVGVEFVRIAYDVEEAARGIVGAGLPGEFADFLREGGRSAGKTMRSV
jgi:predicted phosphodiesterase